MKKTYIPKNKSKLVILRLIMLLVVLLLFQKNSFAQSKYQESKYVEFDEIRYLTGNLTDYLKRNTEKAVIQKTVSYRDLVNLKTPFTNYGIKGDASEGGALIIVRDPYVEDLYNPLASTELFGNGILYGAYIEENTNKSNKQKGFNVDLFSGYDDNNWETTQKYNSLDVRKLSAYVEMTVKKSQIYNKYFKAWLLRELTVEIIVYTKGKTKLEDLEFAVPGIYKGPSLGNKAWEYLTFKSYYDLRIKELTQDDKLVEEHSIKTDNKKTDEDRKKIIKPKMGNKLKFYIPKLSNPEIDNDFESLDINGVPTIWTALFAEEVKYYCSPNTKPGEFKPWIGLDTWVHTLWVKAYDEFYNEDYTNLNGHKWSPTEKPWTVERHENGQEYYTWEWVVQRRMEPTIDKYEKVHKWGKTKVSKIEDANHEIFYEQRDNQKEGTLMDILHSWPNWGSENNLTRFQKYNGVKYAHGLDSDEILHLKNAGAGHTYFKFNGEDPWKFVYPDESFDPIQDLIFAYRKNREHVKNKNDLYNTKYAGYEIQDLNTSLKFPNGTGEGTASAPGQIKISNSDHKLDFTIPIRVKSPIHSGNNGSSVGKPDPGFYSLIQGTQWPAVDKKGEEYIVKNIPEEERGNLVIMYDFDDGFKSSKQYHKSREAGDSPSEDHYNYIDKNGDWHIKFDIKNWGFQYITLYYQSIPETEMVILGGKELFYIDIMYVSNWDKPLKEGRADRQHLLLNEMRSPGYGGHYDRDTQWGMLSLTNFYRYTINKNDLDFHQFKLSVFDIDPHSFELLNNGTDWYQSKRKLAKRIPTTGLPESLDTELKYYINTCPTQECDNVDNGILSGKGQNWTYDWDRQELGTYQLTVLYKDQSSLHLIFDIVDYQHNQKGDIFSRTLTVKEHEILEKLDGFDKDENYKVLEIESVLSKYKLLEGPRNNKIPNRFGDDKDYAYQYKWEFLQNDKTYLNYFESADIVPEFISKFLESYDQYVKFPNDWVYHYFKNTYKGNSNNDIPPDVKNDRLIDDINNTEITSRLDNLFGEENNEGEPTKKQKWKQINFPWAIVSDIEGKRIRTPPKPVFNLNAIWDNDTGAFSGTPNCAEMGCAKYYLTSVKDGNDEFSDPNDKDKDKEALYLKLKTGKMIILPADDDKVAEKTEGIIKVTNDIDAYSGTKKFFDLAQKEYVFTDANRLIVEKDIADYPTFTIDIDKEFQEIDAFGASDAWFPRIANYLSPTTFDLASAKLFSLGVDATNGDPIGIGLSGWRFNVGTGSFEQGIKSGISDERRRTQGYYYNNGNIDFSKNSGALKWLKKAAENEGNELTMFSNSPPVNLTKNTKAFIEGTDPDSNNLEGKNAQPFAKYLVNLAASFYKGDFYKDGTRIKFNYISPVNEPQYWWNDGAQEGNSMANTFFRDLALLIAKQLDVTASALPQTNNLYTDFDTKVIASEANTYRTLLDPYGIGTNGKTFGSRNNGSYNQIKDLFVPLQALNKTHFTVLGKEERIAEIVNVHGYKSFLFDDSHTFVGIDFPEPSNMSFAIALRRRVRKKVAQSLDGWKISQSELAFYGDNGSEVDLGMWTALRVARAIHLDLTQANVNSWYWWTAISSYDYKDGLMYLVPHSWDDDRYLDEFKTSKTLYALGHFSRFIRPGMKRVRVTNNFDISDLEQTSINSEGIMVSAYQGKNEHNEQNLVIVVVNISEKDKEISFDIPEKYRRQGVIELDHYLTDETRSLAQQDPYNSVTDITKNILRQSISTFTFQPLSNNPTSPKSTGKGNVTDSEVVLDTNVEEDMIEIFPNPTDDTKRINVQYANFVEGNVKISFVDMKGRIVLETNQDLGENQKLINIDVETITTGTYILKLVGAGVDIRRSIFIK